MRENADKDWQENDEDSDTQGRSGGGGGVREAVDRRVRGVVDGTKQRLNKLKGEVFHVVTANNRLLRLKIGRDGTLSLDKMLEAGKEARERVMEAGKVVKERGKRKLRKVVTGDPDKRVRDHMREVPQVKFMDKMSFTFGVLTICGLQWLALRHSDWFPMAYYAIIIKLLSLRYFLYKMDKFQLFMIDFCYFVNASVILQTAFYPENSMWFKANYTLALGPLLLAIIVWRNSLVFHSLDKLTSFFLHFMPPLTMHLFRFRVMTSSAIREDDVLSYGEIFSLPIGLYITWQLGYWFITEVLMGSQLASDKQLATSLRWLAKDRKNVFRNLIIKILERTGINDKGEHFDAETLKAKVIFALIQLLYTSITILPTPWLYWSYEASCLYLMFVFSWGTWNGASYYIEVFSEQYKLQFLKREEDSSSEGSREPDDEEEENYENALEDLDEEGEKELYQSILDFMKNSEDSLGLSLPESRSSPASVSPFLLAGVANASTSTESDTIVDKLEPVNSPDTATEISRAAAQSLLEEHMTPEYIHVKEQMTPEGEEEEEEEDPDLQTKRLLEEAATESIGKRSSNSSSESNGKSHDSAESEKSWANLDE